MGSRLSRHHSEIPSDIIFEILTRTSSLETLDACKSVCKAWNGITYKSDFMPTYCERTKNFYGYFIQYMQHNTYRSMFVSLDHNTKKTVGIEQLPLDNKILASSDYGILCCVRPTANGNHRYYTCKPTTGQWQALPNPKLKFRQAAVAMMVQPFSSCSIHSCLRYKIIRLSGRGLLESMSGYYKYKCEVFDSKWWKWCELEEDILLPYEESILPLKPAVSAGASIYWLTTQKNILSFNPKDNSFHKLRIPEHLDGFCKDIMEYQGKLGLIYSRTNDSERMELWTLEDRKANRWTRKMRLSFENLEDVVKNPSLACFYNENIAFLKAAFGEMVFYKLEEGSWDIVKLDGLNNVSEIFPFRSDSEPVNLHRCPMKPEEKKSISAIYMVCCILCVLLLMVICYVSFQFLS